LLKESSFEELSKIIGFLIKFREELGPYLDGQGLADELRQSTLRFVEEVHE